MATRFQSFPFIFSTWRLPADDCREKLFPGGILMCWVFGGVFWGMPTSLGPISSRTVSDLWKFFGIWYIVNDRLGDLAGQEPMVLNYHKITGVDRFSCVVLCHQTDAQWDAMHSCNCSDTSAWVKVPSNGRVIYLFFSLGFYVFVRCMCIYIYSYIYILVIDIISYIYMHHPTSFPPVPVMIDIRKAFHFHLRFHGLGCWIATFQWWLRLYSQNTLFVYIFGS